MSKSFGLPGIRIGWLASLDRWILEQALVIREHISITNSVVGEEIAVRVLEKAEEYIEHAQKHAIRNFEVVTKWMEQQNHVEWVPPEAGVVSLPRIKSGQLKNPEELWRLLVEKYRTFTIPGRCFEMENNYFRLGFGSEPEEIQIGLKNLNDAIEEIMNR
jgi:aspartate/methionine/tyrosine aminotransferase